MKRILNPWVNREGYAAGLTQRGGGTASVVALRIHVAYTWSSMRMVTMW